MQTDEPNSNRIEWGDADTDAGEELPRPGELLAGRFRVESVLGVGGMGIVVGCKHLHLNQRVALKILRKEATRNPEAVTRFLREARAAASIHSDHVVRIMDVGTLRATRTEAMVEIELPYMVMEMLSGTDLDRMLSARGPLPIDEAVGYVLQVCAAVAAAHALGIVHRDLKPANLFVTQVTGDLPLVKVLDFGISKMTGPSDGDAEDSKLTMTGTIVGSPVYMSPEQVRGSDLDSRSDIWALGSILHELLTGRQPFEADAMSALYAKIVADSPPPLRSLRKDAPAGLEAVIRKCLEKDADRRFANAQELARALLPFTKAPMRSSVESLVKGPRPKGPAVTGASSAQPSRGRAGGARPIVLLGVVLGVVLAGGLAFFLGTRGEKDRAAAPDAIEGQGAPSALAAPTTTGAVTGAPVAATAPPAAATEAPAAATSKTAEPSLTPAPPPGDSKLDTGSAPVKAARPDAPAKSATARPPTAPTSLPAPPGGGVNVDPLDGRK